jgi:HAD superfamily hydrolase (TIGR01509 family)
MTKPIWLLLDFDNTMMATEQYAVPSLIARFNDLYGSQLSAPLTFEEFKKHFHGQARETLCANLSNHFNITVDYPTLYESREWRMMQHLQKIKGGVPMAPGLIDALTALEKQGVEFAFVSNNPIQRGLTAMRFADNGCGKELAKFFSCNYFEAGDVQKPKPDVYLRAMEQLGTDTAHCFAVEDSISGASAAVAAGIPTFAFTAYTDNADEMKAKLLEKGCIAAFNNWNEFVDLFNQTLKQKSAA